MSGFEEAVEAARKAKSGGRSPPEPWFDKRWAELQWYLVEAIGAESMPAYLRFQAQLWEGRLRRQKNGDFVIVAKPAQGAPFIASDDPDALEKAESRADLIRHGSLILMTRAEAAELIGSYSG